MSDTERSGPSMDDELSLPKGMVICCITNFSVLLNRSSLIATVQKLINEMMPEGIICAKDTRDLLIDCCVGKIKTQTKAN